MRDPGIRYTMGVRTRLSWVVVLFTMRTGDILVQWLNFSDLSSEELERGLIIGRPPFYLWILLLVFTVIGTVTYVLETLNTFSVFFCDGQTCVSIVLEQAVILLLEHIPLAATNFFISRCRGQYGSLVQTFSGIIFIIYVFTRLIWYAHMEGKLLQSGKEVKVKNCMFMLCCALYACSMSFPVSMWRSNLEVNQIEKHIYDVGIYMIKAPLLDRQRVSNYNLDQILESQGRDRTKPYLVKSLTQITSEGDNGFIAYYKCNLSASFIPKECTANGSIAFKFVYAAYTEGGPYGEIMYNFAFIPAAAKSLNASSVCIPSKADLQEEWSMFYFKARGPQKESEIFTHVQVDSPWSTCTMPKPWYDPGIKVCRK